MKLRNIVLNLPTKKSTPTILSDDKMNTEDIESIKVYLAIIFSCGGVLIFNSLIMIPYWLS